MHLLTVIVQRRRVGSSLLLLNLLGVLLILNLINDLCHSTVVQSCRLRGVLALRLLRLVLLLVRSSLVLLLVRRLGTLTLRGLLIILLGNRAIAFDCVIVFVFSQSSLRNYWLGLGTAGIALDNRQSWQLCQIFLTFFRRCLFARIVCLLCSFFTLGNIYL